MGSGEFLVPSDPLSLFLPVSRHPEPQPLSRGPGHDAVRWSPAWEPQLGAARDTQHFKGPAAGRPDPAQHFASHGASTAAAHRVPRSRERLRCEPSASWQGNARAHCRLMAQQRWPVPGGGLPSVWLPECGTLHPGAWRISALVQNPPVQQRW